MLYYSSYKLKTVGQTIQKAFLPCRPSAAAQFPLRLLMYLRTQCTNEGLRLKYTKVQKQNIYVTHKTVKMHKIRHLHTG